MSFISIIKPISKQSCQKRYGMEMNGKMSQTGPKFERKVRGKKGESGLSEEQMKEIMSASRKYIDQQLLPIKKSIDAIFKKLEITDIHITAEETQKIAPKPAQINQSSDDSFNNLDLNDDQLDVDTPLNLNPVQKDDKNEEFQFTDLIKDSGRPSQTANKLTQNKIQPQGNNTSYNPINFPPNPPMQGILPQHQQPWSNLYHKVRNLILNKRKRGQRGWFDYQKRLLLDFVTKGAKYGCNPYDLTMQLGVSHSTFKRWRNYFK